MNAMKTLGSRRMEACAKQLRKHQFPTYVVQDIEEAKRVMCELIKDGEHVATGGSMSIEESSILAMLQTMDINFVEHKANASEEERKQEAIHALCADTYICSANAITLQGEIYNVDGSGNRVAMMIYGPKQVLIIAGVNKLVSDMEQAKVRLREIAAPANCIRLDKKTPCTIIGSCQDCMSKDRICCAHVMMNYQREERIKVILVNETLGY